MEISVTDKNTATPSIKLLRVQRDENFQFSAQSREAATHVHSWTPPNPPHTSPHRCQVWGAGLREWAREGVTATGAKLVKQPGLRNYGKATFLEDEKEVFFSFVFKPNQRGTEYKTKGQDK